MFQYISNSYKDTEEFAKKIAATLNGTEIIALFGDLGAGKTCFTRGLVSGLESKSEVSSPTFAIINEYTGKFPIYHFDMYRISSYDDLFSTGYFDYIGNGVIVIEWSENIESELDNNAIRISIKYGGHDNQRIFTIEGLNDEKDFIC